MQQINWLYTKKKICQIDAKLPLYSDTALAGIKIKNECLLNCNRTPFSEKYRGKKYPKKASLISN